MRDISLGYSPCPNDTFIFYALVHGKLGQEGIRAHERLEDVETLNRLAFEGAVDVTKVSYAAFGSLRDGYCLLRSGGALGRGCGPLVVSKTETTMEGLRGCRMAIPGMNTTAFLLLRLYDPALGDNVKVMPFHEVMEAVRDGEVDAGLLIHEGRFTYPRYGLREIEDLGRWWEAETGLPIPLGCIVAKRELGPEVISGVGRMVRQSVLYAMANRQEPMDYIKKHSQELEDDVIEEHIRLYVNDYTVDIGEDGTAAVETLFKMAEERGVIKKSRLPIFCP